MRRYSNTKFLSTQRGKRCDVIRDVAFFRVAFSLWPLPVSPCLEYRKIHITNTGGVGGLGDKLSENISQLKNHGRGKLNWWTKKKRKKSSTEGRIGN